MALPPPEWGLLVHSIFYSSFRSLAAISLKIRAAAIRQAVAILPVVVATIDR